MKILLINPPYSRLRLTKECTEMVSPLGLVYLAAAAAADGFDVSIYDANYSGAERMRRMNGVKRLMESYHLYRDNLADGDHPVWRECYERIRAEAPDVIGITALTPVLGAAKKLAAVCREAAPGAVVVFGGFHPTCRPGDVLLDGSADAVVRGEGEETFVELLGRVRDKLPYGDVAGVSVRENGTVRSNPDRPLIEDLSKLPSIAGFIGHAAAGKLPVQYGRGCLFSCKFCSDSAVWRRKSRYIPAGRLADELAGIVRRHGAREFTFVDGTFNLHRERVMELCEEILKRRLKILWDALVRADTLDDGMLAMCRRAGCVQMNVGVESGSPAVLRDLRKGTDLGAVREGIGRIRKHGIAAVSFFCAGMPPETAGDMKATRDLILSLPHDYVILHLFTPMPGSKYFDELESEGRINAGHDYDSFGYKSPGNYFTRNVGREEFERCRDEISKAADRVNGRGRLVLKLLFNNLGFYIRRPRLLLRRALQFVK